MPKQKKNTGKNKILQPENLLSFAHDLMKIEWVHNLRSAADTEKKFDVVELKSFEQWGNDKSMKIVNRDDDDKDQHAALISVFPQAKKPTSKKDEE